MSELIQVCIQVAAGSCERKIYNEKTLELLETRQSGLPYPYAYGFILGTHAQDGGNLDCYVMTSEKLPSGVVVTCQPVGLVAQYEGDELDQKVIATLPGETLLIDDALYQQLKGFILTSFADCPEMIIRVGPLLPRQAAIDCIQASRLEPA